VQNNIVIDNPCNHYDYIILGGGASGLSLADRFLAQELRHYNVLIIEKEEKVTNDHTWCSWVKGSHRYDELAKKTWTTLNVFSNKGDKKTLGKSPYRYRMIEAVDFYKSIKSKIANSTNIHIRQESFVSMQESNDKVEVKTNNNIYTANHVFKSFIDVKIDKANCLYVDQHFKGWFVETMHDFFDEQACHLMDFRVEQNGEVRFMYVLPTSQRKALIELAIFSNEILSQEDYDAVIKKYVDEQLKLPSYKIAQSEFGIIPMTTHDFKQYDTNRITMIGTMAGAVKPSTGYAFTRIQAHLDEVVKCILRNENPRNAQAVYKQKYKLYDATMLDVLLNKNLSGADFFYDLFIDNSAEDVFKFLDEETSLREEIKLMNTVDRWVFGKSFFRQLSMKIFQKK
jgi:lycopene beta-cyclase